MKFLNELRRKFLLFMRGRYGQDELNTVILILYLIVIVLTYLIGNRRIDSGLNLFALGLMIILLYRTFSKNIFQRSKENELYLKYKHKLLNQQQFKKSEPKIFTCPNCSQKVRVPRGRGKIEITCPKCSHKFTKRT